LYICVYYTCVFAPTQNKQQAQQRSSAAAGEEFSKVGFRVIVYSAFSSELPFENFYLLQGQCGGRLCHRSFFVFIGCLQAAASEYLNITKYHR